MWKLHSDKKTWNSVVFAFFFPGHNEGTLAMKEGEILYIIEEDKGDGWTRARRQNGEEGYVPTSYIDVTLEKNSKGAVTYI